jgi:phosphoribosylformylglycinamidine cyclo-ligase
VIYTPAVRAAIAAAEVHAAAHITGGGFEGNIPRALPDGTRAVLERGSWEVPALFGEIRRLGRVSDEEMARVFNLGLGMVLVVGAASAGDALEALGTAGLAPVIVGRVEEGEPGVELVGPGFWPGTDGGPDQER